MLVFIILLEDDLVVFGFLVLVMDFLLIKLRKLRVNFLRIFNFFYLLIIYFNSFLFFICIFFNFIFYIR